MADTWPLPMNPAFRRILLETAETLAIALAGGVTCVLLGLPAGLVSGSVVAVAAAAFVGRPVRGAGGLGRGLFGVVWALLRTGGATETMQRGDTWPVRV